MPVLPYRTASATIFMRFTGLLFEDGFESGDTSAWPLGGR